MYKRLPKIITRGELYDRILSDCDCNYSRSELKEFDADTLIIIYYTYVREV